MYCWWKVTVNILSSPALSLFDYLYSINIVYYTSILKTPHLSNHLSTLMRLLCLRLCSRLWSFVKDWQKDLKLHFVRVNTESDSVKYYYRRSNPLPFLESYKAILNWAFYFAFEEQGGRSVGRKAPEPLNRVALMNSLLCQRFFFFSFFAKIWLWESGREKREDILKTNRGWEEEDEFTIDKLLHPQRDE